MTLDQLVQIFNSLGYKLKLLLTRLKHYVSQVQDRLNKMYESFKQKLVQFKKNLKVLRADLRK